MTAVQDKCGVAPRNRLLSALNETDHFLIAPDLQYVELPIRYHVERIGELVDYVYFPQRGVISVVAKQDQTQIEVGLIGREGMSGMAVVLGNHRPSFEAYVQIEGFGYRIEARRFRELLRESETFRDRVQRYALVFMTQVAQTAFANAKLDVEGRLARWLLMASDRQGESDLRLTHKFLAMMLGVRRPGVTDALNALEGKGFIRAKRAHIRLLHREGLKALAGGSYGFSEAEYIRLLGGES